MVFRFKQQGLTRHTGRCQEKSLLPGAELKVVTGDLISSQHGNPLALAQELPNERPRARLPEVGGHGRVLLVGSTGCSPPGLLGGGW